MEINDDDDDFYFFEKLYENHLTWDYVKLIFHQFIEEKEIANSVARRLQHNSKWERNKYILEAEDESRNCFELILLFYCCLQKKISFEK